MDVDTIVTLGPDDLLMTVAATGGTLQQVLGQDLPAFGAHALPGSRAVLFFSSMADPRSGLLFWTPEIGVC